MAKCLNKWNHSSLVFPKKLSNKSLDLSKHTIFKILSYPKEMCVKWPLFIYMSRWLINQLLFIAANSIIGRSQ